MRRDHFGTEHFFFPVKNKIEEKNGKVSPEDNEQKMRRVGHTFYLEQK